MAFAARPARRRWLALVVGIAGLPLAGCGLPTAVAPDRTSPVSAQAEEAPLPQIAQALTAQPTDGQSHVPSPASAAGAGTHVHGAAAAPGADPAEVHVHGPAAAPGADDGTDHHPAAYVCPMHADVTAAGPAKCPRCGMALVPAAQDTATDGAPTAPKTQGVPAAPKPERAPAAPKTMNSHHGH